MLKRGLLAAASIVAFSFVSAAEEAAKQHGENKPKAPDAGAAVGEGTSASRVGIVVGESTGSNAVVSGTAVLQSGARAPGFVPMTPFVAYTTSAHAGNDPETEARIRDIQEREQRLLQLPEYRDLLRARQRLSLTQMHRDLPDLLQISKEQADQLLDLLAEQHVREQAERRPMLPSPGDMAAMQAFMEWNEQRRKANEAEIAALLGDSKFQEWQEYEQSTMARFLVQRFQSTLPSDASLRADQLRPLVRVIAREQRQLFEGAALTLPQGQIPDEEFQKRMQEQQVERMTAMNKRILDASASILSPRQLEHLEAMLKQELEGVSQRQFFFGARAPLVAPRPLPSQN